MARSEIEGHRDPGPHPPAVLAGSASTRGALLLSLVSGLLLGTPALHPGDPPRDMERPPASWRTAAGLSAQTLSEVRFERRMAGESEVQVEVEYGAGVFRLTPGDPGQLYRARFRFDETGPQPLHRWDGRVLHLGLEGGGHRRPTIRRSPDGAELDLRLGTGVPMELELTFGAVRADLDLGGIPLRRVTLTTGASETSVRVGQRNPELLQEARFQVGAASFRARELGRLRARSLVVEAGVGEVHLDFTGLEEGESTLRVTMGLGALELVIPEEVGVHLTRRSSFLASMNAPGFEQSGNTWQTPGWPSAPRRLRIELESALGSVTVTRVR